LRQTRRAKAVLQQNQILNPNGLENVRVKQKKARNERCEVYGNHSVFTILNRDWRKQSSRDVHCCKPSISNIRGKARNTRAYDVVS
jgi:hypothetical protein